MENILDIPGTYTWKGGSFICLYPFSFSLFHVSRSDIRQYSMYGSEMGQELLEDLENERMRINLRMDITRTRTREDYWVVSCFLSINTLTVYIQVVFLYDLGTVVIKYVRKQGLSKIM
ncbi:hypothetical protein V8F33_004453 [Rhypophila sp. PSN 637]